MRRLFFAVMIIGLLGLSGCGSDRMPGCWIGAFLGDVPSLKDLDRFQKDYGKNAALVLIFLDWGKYPDERLIMDVYGRGGALVVTWEPWNASSKKGIDLDALLSGKDDEYLRSFALRLRSIRKPVFLRFAHEMNGNWYPWSGHQIGGAKYQRIFRYLHTVFDAMGARNVRWIFSINAENVPPANVYDLCYPGTRFVDYIGLDGYNWGATQSWSRWRSFSSIFSGIYADVRRKYRKPVIVTEFGTASAGGDKSRWIEEALKQMKKMTDLRGVVLFNTDKEADWGFSPETSAGKALRRGLKDLFFLGAVGGDPK